jgi:hypothetical protein
MNPFKAIARGVTAPVRAVRNTAKLLTLRSRALDVYQLAEEAEADPRLYRDAAWRARTCTALGELVAVLPIPKEIRIVIQNLFSNWKTTLIGLGAAAGVVFLQAIGAGQSVKTAATAAALAALGMASKDSNVTGGTKEQ